LINHHNHPIATAGYRHEALFYAGEREFLATTGAFLREGMQGGEPTLVVVSARKIGLLREALGRDAGRVMFKDMAEVGANPNRIIPAWREFVSQNSDSGRPLRGIGEPIYPERSPAELVECQRHEALLNQAFINDAHPFWLLCPYDVKAMPAAVIEEARRSHPHLAKGSKHGPSDDYRGLEVEGAPFDGPLPEPPPGTPELSFQGGPLAGLRHFVARQARAARLGSQRTAELVVAVDEVVTNSLQHAGGGSLRIWRDGGTLLCEVRDKGRIEHPMVGRQKPARIEDPRGLWLVNQLSDLVQIRSSEAGNVVRIHKHTA
jgi:anti-sigma regulatory factor (Ser/Thr protein kinase)